MSDQENLNQGEEQEDVEGHAVKLNRPMGSGEPDVEGHKLAEGEEEGDDVEAHRYNTRPTVDRPTVD